MRDDGQGDPGDRPLRLALGGDWMATRGAVLGAGSGPQGLRELLRAADFAFANLEVAACGWAGHPVRDPWGSTLAAGTHVLDDLRDAGVTMVSCANNHALDMGHEGLRAALAALAARGVAAAGAGPDLTSARMPAYVDRPAGSAALVACTASFAPGQEAAPHGLQLPGRPGISPLRHRQLLRVTPDQLAALRAVDRETGLAAGRAGLVAMMGSDPWDDAADPFPFLGGLFTAADTPGLRTTAEEEDQAAILLWVREARQRADLVVVSIHTHESGGSPEEPAEFVRGFAHAAVEAGADVVVGHGPHVLRGIEVYRGRPVFYSLGNLVSQIELTERLPAEDYAKLAAGGRPVTPFGFFNARSLAETRGFAAHREYWETVVPVVTTAPPDGDDGRHRPAAVELHPVTLGFGRPAHRRGRPELACPEDGLRILKRLGELSAPYATPFELAESATGPIARIPLP